MSLLAIIIIIILGIFLLLVEFLIIPGFTVFGIGGFVFIFLGIGSSYYFHSIQTGNITLIMHSSYFTRHHLFYFQAKNMEENGLKSKY